MPGSWFEWSDLSPSRQAVLAALHGAEYALSGPDVVAITGLSPGLVRRQLARAALAGQITRLARGYYGERP